jgi:hypothetical protein
LLEAPTHCWHGSVLSILAIGILSARCACLLFSPTIAFAYGLVLGLLNPPLSSKPLSLGWDRPRLPAQTLQHVLQISKILFSAVTVEM